MSQPCIERYTFTVPSKGICVMCLTDTTSAKSKTKAEEVSLHTLHSFLKLDYRKIFNISSAKIFQRDDSESETECVDIKVSLCRSCSDLRNKFCDMYKEMEMVQQRVNSCVQSMLEVMINAESNAILTRHYRQKITGIQGNSATATSVVEQLKKSIPDKFRKETMHRCVVQVEKARQKRSEATIPKEQPETDELDLEFSDALPKESLKRKSVGTGWKDSSGTGEGFSDEDEGMKMDEDADPEELMNRYDSFADNSKFSGNEDSSGAANGLDSMNGTIWDDEEDGLEFDESGDSNGFAGGDNRASFNSKYKCNICNKVVVSLKNFELHQRRHTGEKPFACPFCEQHFRDTSNLRSHTLRYHRQFLFANFKQASLVEEDFKIALDKIVQSIVQVTESVGASHQSHKCYLCNKEYTQKYAIEDHIVQRHYDVLSTAILHLQKDILSYASPDIAQYMAQINDSGETCTICGLCGQQFSSGLEVNSHMKVHVKVKVARSQGAIQKSNTSDSLIQLKMKCNFCSKYFEDLNALTKHKTVHQGNCASSASRETVYVCEHCNRSFCSYYSQRSHVLSFHRYQVFAKYLPPGTTSAEIEDVVKGITGKYTKLPSGLFQCSLCNKEITQLRKLQSHMLVTHFDEVVIKLKVAIHRLHKGRRTSAVDGDGSPPELDNYGEMISGNGLSNLNFGEDYDDDDNLGMEFVNDEDGDATQNLEVIFSCPE